MKFVDKYFNIVLTGIACLLCLYASAQSNRNFNSKAIWPPNNGVIISNTIPFNWFLNRTPTNYCIQVSSTTDFTSNLINESELTDTLYFLEELPPVGDYFWRIGDCKGNWSTANKFAVADLNKLGNLAWWISAGESVTTFPSSDAVNSILNLSTRGGQAEQIEETKAPTVSNIAEINNQPSMLFRGAEKRLNLSSDLTAGDLTIFSVAKKQENASTLIFFGDSTSTNALSVLGNWNGGRTFFGPDPTKTNVVRTISFLDYILFRGDYNNGLLSIYHNRLNLGNVQTSDEGSFNIIGSNGIGTVTDGFIAEIIAYEDQLDELTIETIESYLQTRYSPPISLPNDIYFDYRICDTVIGVSEHFVQYQWSTGDTSSSISVNRPGTYSVSVLDAFGQFSADSIQVFWSDEFKSLKDTFVCLDESIELNTGLGDEYNFEWNTGANTPTLRVTDSNSYSVVITDDFGCSDTLGPINVQVDSFKLKVSLGADTTLCINNKLHLKRGGDLIDNYLWSDNSDTNYILVTGSKNYALTVSNKQGCLASDNINIIANSKAPILDFNIHAICTNELSTFLENSSTPPIDSIIEWNWYFGDGFMDSIRQPQHNYITPGDYEVKLEVDTKLGCKQEARRQITIYNPPEIKYNYQSVIFLGEEITFENESFAEDQDILFSNWDFGNGHQLNEFSPSFEYGEIGSYQVVSTQITNKECTSIDTAKITVLNSIDDERVVLWLAADRNVTHDIDGFISEIGGHGASMNNGKQNIIAHEPKLIENILQLNNLNAIAFQGINQFLELDKAIDSTRFTIYSIVRHIDNRFVILGNSNSNYGFNGFLFFTGTRLLFNPGESGYVFFDREQRTQFSLLKCIYDLNEVSIYENGELIAKKPNTFNGNFDWIGKNGAGTISEGELAEIIVFDKILSITEQRDIEKYLYDKYAPPVNIGIDTIYHEHSICPVNLTVEGYYTNLKWSTGELLKKVQVFETGNYVVSATDIFGNISVDSVFVSFPSTDISFHDSVICSGNKNFLEIINTGSFDYTWSNGLTSSAIEVTTEGVYQVTISDSLGCSIVSKPVFINVDSFETNLTLGFDEQGLCAGEFLSLVNGASEAVSYQWSTGATTPFIPVNNSGDYSVTVENVNGCVGVDTVSIVIKPNPPVAEFMADRPCLGDPMNFTDISKEIGGNAIVKWSWDFGNNESSSFQNPQVFYNQSGFYAVNLEVEGQNGCAHDTLISVEVKDIPTALFNFQQPVCTGNEMTFANESNGSGGGIDQYTWSFGDGSELDNDIVPTKSYDATGNYTITLEVKGLNGCKDEFSAPVSVLSSPMVTFNAIATCVGDAVDFIPESSVPPTNGLLWDFGDGTIDNDNLVTSHIYGAAGVYDVRLLVRASYGCEGTALQQVRVTDRPIVDFNKDSICAGEPYTFVDKSTASETSIVARRWDFDGASANTVVTNYTFGGVGVFPVTLTVTDDVGCVESSTRDVIAHESPQAGFEFDPAYGAPPLASRFINTARNATNYEWFVDDDFESIDEEPIYVFRLQKRYDVLQIAYNEFGCRDSSDRTINVVEPVLDVAITQLDAKGERQFDRSIRIPITVELVNQGTRDVNRLELFAKTGYSTPVFETWTGELRPGESMTYEFESQYYVAPDIEVGYLCVDVKHPNPDIDATENDNLDCVAQTEFVEVLNAYPVPASEEVYLDVVLPIEDRRITVTVVNSLGMDIDVPLDELEINGLQRYRLDVTSLPTGAYFFKVKYWAEVEPIIKPFVIAR